METQLDYDVTEDLCPKDIATQLLELAKKHDALGLIGDATQWRWSQGINTLYPRTTTITKVLTKVFNSNDPDVWVAKTEGELKTYLKYKFPIRKSTPISCDFSDIYVTAIRLSLHTKRGFLFEEMVNQLCLIKHAKSTNSHLENEDIDEEIVCDLHRNWAAKLLINYLKSQGIKEKEDGFYRERTGFWENSDDLLKYQLELAILRFKMVGSNSHFDLYRLYNVALSDREALIIGNMINEFFSTVVEKVKSFSDDKNDDPKKNRNFSFVGTTSPLAPKESLKWKN